MVSPAILCRTLIVAALAAILAFAPAQAQQIVVTTTVSWTYEAADTGFDDDTIDEQAAPFDDEATADDADTDVGATRRYAPSGTLAALGHARAKFGPFAVVDDATVRMAGDVTSATPRQFAAMLAAYPHLKRLEMIDCPGSLDEEANLILARAVRRAGLEFAGPCRELYLDVQGPEETWVTELQQPVA